MNANELAEIQAFKTEELTMWERNHTATMLRQQHKELEHMWMANTVLKVEVESMQERMIVAEKELNHMRSFFGCDPAYYGMTPAEPVAWMHKDDRDTFFSSIDHSIDSKWISLYTHPAKTLTDEEIQQVLNDFDWFVNFVNPFDFARAILRKAQEK